VEKLPVSGRIIHCSEFIFKTLNQQIMKTWSYLINPFLVTVIKSYKKAVLISSYTNSQLLARKADPFYGPLYLMYNPLHVALLNAYNNWKSEGGTQKGSTLTLTQLLGLITGKLANWEYAIIGQFAKGSPEYVAIFPQGHKPFHKGGEDMRIQTVGQLAGALEGIAPLAATLADVNNFYKQLTDARDAQEGNIGDTKSNSEDVNAAVKAAMISLYSILGSCIGQFADTPLVIEAIFYMELVRNHEQAIFTGTLKALRNKTVFKHTFALTDEFTLGNTGLTILQFYLAAGNHDAPGTYTIITLNPGETKTVKASDFGVATNPYLHVINTDNAAEGHFKVEL
jgi:hypothetical protein